MLYVFHGTDATQAAIKARALADSLQKKRPDAAFVKMDGDSWNASAIEGHLGGQGLFSNKYIVLLDRVTENKDAKEGLADLIPAMQESPNIFIVSEGKLLTELKKAVEKSAEKVVECELKKEESKEPSFNVFALADAVGKKDPVRSWMLYRKAVDSGMESEAIIGMLFWKAKTAMDRELARELITLYHDGHRGLRDLELGVERLVLELH